MTTATRLVVLGILAAFGLAAPASAADPAKTAAFLEARPCGPDSMTGPLRYLIPQGFAGADFRPGCRTHDACYSNPNCTREQCEAGYKRDLVASCDNSRFPRVCRAVARFDANMVNRFGEGAYQEAQAKARR